MKALIAHLFIFLSLSCYSQNVEKITKSFNVPDGWKSRTVKDTSFFPTFGKRHVAIWEFKCDDGRTEPMWFYVFKYTKEDSALYNQKANLYYALSNCLLASNNDIKENFMSFVKGDYFFVERMCPCYTRTNSNCRTLVTQLSNWLEDKKAATAAGTSN